MQVAALAAALGGALLLTWTERIWPDVQEAVIGVVFVLGATGQRAAAREQRRTAASTCATCSSARSSGRSRRGCCGRPRSTRSSSRCGSAGASASAASGFYALFALAVTVSVQLVGLYLVFATLIVPPLATRRMTRGRLAAAWALGVAGYALGLVLSTALDLPSGPVIVWALVVLALCWYAVTGWRGPRERIRG